MTDVILVNCLGDLVVTRTPVEHLGLAYLASVLEQQGIGVRVIDASFHGIARSSVCEIILAEHPRVAGFTTYYNNIAETLAAAADLRGAGFGGHITLGGHHAAFNAVEILADCPEVDTIIWGEGEGPLVDLVHCLMAGREPHDIPNLIYRRDGGVVAVPCRRLIEDLDELPFPRRADYDEHLRQQKVATVVSSRGCYGQCTFCSIRAFYGAARGPAWRARSPGNVVDEVEYLEREYGVQRINFLDDEFIGVGRKGQRRAQAIGEEILRRRLQVSFSIVCRPDNLNPEVLRVLKEAGLDCVDIGVESWVPRQLALYGKRVSREQNLAAIATLKRLGIQYRLYVMPFDPYLTVDELLDNMDGAEKAGLEHLHDGSFLARLVVFKGTNLEELLRQDGVLRVPDRGSYLNFLDYDFRDPQIRRLYPMIHEIAAEQNGLNNRLRAIFWADGLNTEEIAFGVRLKLAISRAFLTCLRDLLTCQKPEEEFAAIRATIVDIYASLSRVEAASRDGTFARFATCQFDIGREVVEFPSSALRSLAEAVTSPTSE